MMGSEMMSGVKMGVMFIGLLLLAMVPKTMQLPMDHPLHSVVRRINDVNGPFLGLVLSSSSDEKILLDSGFYVPNPRSPSIKISGRTFNIGTFKDVPVVYVLSSAPMAAVSVTVQILVENFRIKGIIDYGNAATISSSFKIADVAVLSDTAYSSAWTWKKYESDVEATELPSLKIGEYNVPEPGDNKLATIQFEKVKKYTPKGLKKEVFWFYIDPEWLQIASPLKDLKLERCVSENACSNEEPSVVYGVKGASSDAYLENEAYAKFLNHHLDISAVDRKSAATVSTAVANGVKHIVFRAASNKPGVPYDAQLGALASKNNFKVVSEFIGLIASQDPATKYY